MFSRLFIICSLFLTSLLTASADVPNISLINVKNPLDKKELATIIEKNLVLPKNILKNEGVVVQLSINKEGFVEKVSVLHQQNPEVTAAIVKVVNRLKFRYVIMDENTENSMSYNLVFKIYAKTNA